MEIIPDSVMIGYVHMHTVFEGFARSLAETCLNKDNNIYGIIASQNPRQEAARNATIQKFMEGFNDGRNHYGAEWFMWLDTDQTFEHDAIARLRDTAHNYDADAVGGLTFVYQRGAQEVHPNGWYWDGEHFVWIEDYEPGKVYEINGTGSAFVLINRKVFEAWDGDWHVTHVNHPATGEYMGHDLAFFHKMSVDDGFKLVWDTSVQSGHIKHFELTETQYHAYRSSLET